MSLLTHILSKPQLCAIYILSILIHYTQNSFWIIVVLSARLNFSLLEEIAKPFGLCLIIAGILDICFGYLNKFINNKFIVMTGLFLLSIGSILFIYGYSIYITYAFLSAGVASISGNSESWFIRTKNMIAPHIDDSLFIGYLHHGRRISLIINAITAGLLMTNKSITWYFFAVSSVLALIISCILNSDPSSKSFQEDDLAPENLVDFDIINILALIGIYFAQFFYGMEMGLRALLFNPFFVYDLGGNSPWMMSLKTLIAAFAGFLGNKVFIKLIKSNAEPSTNSINLKFLALSSLIYGAFEISTYFITDIFFWLAGLCLSILSMGWYLPMLDAIITRNTPKKYLSMALSIKSGIHFIVGGMTLILLSEKLTNDNMRFFIFIAGICLTLSSIIYLIAAFKLESISTLRIKKYFRLKQDCLKDS